MRTITATDLWKSPKEHLDAVSRGEVLKIIRSGSTVAALVPLSDLETPSQTAARLERELVQERPEEGRSSLAGRRACEHEKAWDECTDCNQESLDKLDRAVMDAHRRFFAG